MRIALLLISMCLPGFAQVHIYLKFDVPPAEAVLVAMKSQVEVLYRQTEIRFFWMEDGDYREVPGQLLLLQFHGSCSGAGYEPRNEGLPLGWTFKEHGGEVLPFIGLNCDLTRGITGQQEDNIFGRALGYVVGHEVYHALTRTIRHGQGVLKTTFCSHDLLASTLAFSARELTILCELRRQLATAAGE